MSFSLGGFFAQSPAGEIGMMKRIAYALVAVCLSFLVQQSMAASRCGGNYYLLQPEAFTISEIPFPKDFRSMVDNANYHIFLKMVPGSNTIAAAAINLDRDYRVEILLAIDLKTNRVVYRNDDHTFLSNRQITIDKQFDAYFLNDEKLLKRERNSKSDKVIIDDVNAYVKKHAGVSSTYHIEIDGVDPRDLFLKVYGYDVNGAHIEKHLNINLDSSGNIVELRVKTINSKKGYYDFDSDLGGFHRGRYEFSDNLVMQKVKIGKSWFTHSIADHERHKNIIEDRILWTSEKKSYVLTHDRENDELNLRGTRQGNIYYTFSRPVHERVLGVNTTDKTLLSYNQRGQIIKRRPSRKICLKNLRPYEGRELNQRVLLSLLDPFSYTDRKFLFYFGRALAGGGHKEFPLLAVGALQIAGLKNRQMFNQFIGKHPELLNISTHSTKTALQAKARDWALRRITQEIENKIEEPFSTISIEVFRGLSLYSGLIKEITEEKRKYFSKIIYNSLAVEALDRNVIPSIFFSKVIKLVKQQVQIVFGFSKDHFTDLTYTVEYAAGYVQPILIGTSTIGYKNKNISVNDYGFSVLQPDLFRLDEKGPHNYSWTHRGESFTGQISVDQIPSAGALRERKSPNYSDFYKDKKLVGLMAASSNLGSRAAKMTRSYAKYYRSKGFVFSEPISVNSFDYLKKSIAGGEVDYFVKEAHSAGDNQNLMKISEQGKLSVGILSLDGVEYEIRLLEPILNDKTVNDVWIGLRDLSYWIQERDNINPSEFVYVNSSCNSSYQAKNEIAFVGSQNFVDLAASSTTTTFTSKPDHSKRAIYDGILEGATYLEMRERLQQTPRYVEQKHNDFIFPDEDRYAENYRHKDGVFYRVDSQVFDQKGEVYRMSDQFGH